MTNEQDKVQRQRAVKERILNHVKEFPLVTLFSEDNEGFAPHILCFAIRGVRGETIVHAFEEHQIYISTTSALFFKETHGI